MHSDIAVVGPTLGPDVVATAQILEKEGLLNCLITRGIVSVPTRHWLKKSFVGQPFSHRPSSPVAKEKTDPNWLADAIFYLVRALTGSRTKGNDASFAYLDRHAAKQLSKSTNAVFAREDCCVRTFGRAKQLGVKTVYQLPTAYWRKVRDLMEHETAEFPGACTVAEDPYEFAPERTERKNAELELADYVLCPSTFVQKSLEPYRASQLEVLPFGVDRADESQPTQRNPVFLYAGNIMG
jgi:hypothetical protein